MRGGVEMSHRRAKKIRKWLRFSHVDVREARYHMPGGMIQVLRPTGTLDEKGLPLMTKTIKTGTVKLQDGCARLLYKDMKQQGQVRA
jgi:hypothetical protein